MTIPAPSDPFAATRDSWHRVAEHVLAAAQYAETGRIGLRPVAGGFQTTRELRGGRTLRVVGSDLVVSDLSGSRTAPLTTVAAAAEFVGVAPGMPSSVYPPATPLAPDEALFVDAPSARRLADWYELADAALQRMASDLGVTQDPVLWPEHFDVGISVDAVNFGASPGDEVFADPYLYVGPHAGPPQQDAFWNASFGAARSAKNITSAADAVAFFSEGVARLPS